MPDTREALVEAMAKAAHAAEWHRPDDTPWEDVSEAERASARAAAEGAIAAIEAAGCVVVPKVATMEMVKATEEVMVGLDRAALEAICDAMLAASPFAKPEG